MIRTSMYCICFILVVKLGLTTVLFPLFKLPQVSCRRGYNQRRLSCLRNFFPAFSPLFWPITSIFTWKSSYMSLFFFSFALRSCLRRWQLLSFSVIVLCPHTVKGYNLWPQMNLYFHCLIGSTLSAAVPGRSQILSMGSYSSFSLFSSMPCPHRCTCTSFHT